MTRSPRPVRKRILSPTSDDALLQDLDRVEQSISAITRTLNPSLWAAARRTPAAARVVAETMRALANLHQERDALEEGLKT